MSPLHWQGRLGPPFLGRGTAGSVLAAPVFPHPCVPVAITLRIASSSSWLFSLRSLIASSVPDVPGIFLNVLPPSPFFLRSEMAVLKLGIAGGHSGCGTQCDSDFSAVPLSLWLRKLACHLSLFTRALGAHAGSLARNRSRCHRGSGIVKTPRSRSCRL